MSLVTAGPLFKWPGILSTAGTPALGTDATLDAAGEYLAYVFQAREDMTISHVGWRTGAATAGSPTADTRIETVAADGTPSGTLWAANTNLVSGALAASTWALYALTASATINKGDFFCVKVVYASGTTIVINSVAAAIRSAPSNQPWRITNTSGAAVKSLPAVAAMFAFGSSATTFYSLENSFPFSTITGSNFNNTGGARRALRFQVPFACRCVGMQWTSQGSTGDFKAVLLDDAGSVLSSITVDGDFSANSNNGLTTVLFSTQVTLTPGTWYRAAIEPTSATNINTTIAALPSANYRSAWPGGVNHHYATFTTVGGWVDTATDTIPLIEILIDQIDTGGGGAAGYPASRVGLGM